MARRGRVGSKSGVVVKRGAGGKIMGSVKRGADPKVYTIQHSPDHSTTITVNKRSVSGATYIKGTPTRQPYYNSVGNVDRSVAASQLRSARKAGIVRRQVVRPQAAFL